MKRSVTVVVTVVVAVAGAVAAATAIVLTLPAQASAEPDRPTIGISRAEPGPDGVAVPQGPALDDGPQTVEQESELANRSSQTYTVDSSEVGKH